MTEAGPAVPQPGPETQRPTGFFSNLTDLYFAPGDAFAALLRKPNPWVPLLLFMALNLAFTAIWLQKVDKLEFMRAQSEQSPRWERVPVEQRAAILERQASFFGVFAWVGGLVIAPLSIVVVAAVLLFVFRFFYASEVDFKRSLTIAACAFATIALISTPLILGVLSLKGDWNINPQEALQANLSLLLEKQTTAKPLWAAATSLDLFSLWMVFLLAAGHAAVARKPWTWALAGVAVPWALIVAIKVGFAFFM